MSLALAVLAGALAGLGVGPPDRLRVLATARPRSAGQAFVRSRRRLCAAAAAASGLAAAGWGAAGGAGSLLAVLAGLLAARAGHARRRRGELARSRAQWRAVLEALGAALRSGAQPTAALVTALDSTLGAGLAAGPAAGPGRALTGSSLAALARQVRASAALGADLAAVLAQAGGEAARLGVLWRLCVPVGAPLADGVDRLRELHDAQQAARRQAEAALAGPRSAARLLSGLPVLAVLAGTLAGAGPWAVLTTTPVGQVCLVAGVLLEAAGIAAIEALGRGRGDRRR